MALKFEFCCLFVIVLTTSAFSGGKKQTKKATQHVIKRISYDKLIPADDNNKLSTLFNGVEDENTGFLPNFQPILKRRKKPHWTEDEFFETTANFKKVKKEENKKSARNQKVFDILNTIVKRHAVPDLRSPPQHKRSGATEAITQERKKGGKNRVVHNIIKRNAFSNPHPQPKGGGEAGGKIEETAHHVAHQSLLVRKELKVEPIGVVFTIVALLLVFLAMCVLVIWYWKSNS